MRTTHYLLLILLTTLWSCQNPAKPAAGAEASTQCYTLNQPATAEAPTSTVETISLMLDGDEVEGEIAGQMDGPEIQSGYTGTFVGIRSGDTLKVTTVFLIEGSEVTEVQEYLLRGADLLKREGPLEEVDGKMVLKPGATFSQVYQKSTCE